MAVSPIGPYYIFLTGRGTGQTATLYWLNKPVVQTAASSDLLGPYATLALAETKLKSLTITGSVSVAKTNTAGDPNSTVTVIGSVNVSSGSTSNSPAVAGSSEPTNPKQVIQLEGGNEFPDIPNPLGSIAAALSTFIADITSGAMWRSLGWLLLGIVLIIVGLVILVKGSVTNVAGGVLKAAI